MGLKPLGSCLILCVFIAGCTNQTTLPISIAITPAAVALAPGQTVQLTATVTNNKTGVTSPATTNGSQTGISWAATAGSIDANGNYTASSAGQSTTALAIATSKQDRTKFANAIIHVVAPGMVAASGNPQVAVYTITPSSAGNMSVQFGPDTNYALTTWTQPSTSGEAVSLYVAGMKTGTQYHMRATIQFADGSQYTDTDHTYTPATPTGDVPAPPTITATTTPGMTPQSGVELLTLAQGVAWPTITDLDGNVLWRYAGVPNGTVANPIKLIPNGHFVVNFSVGTVDGGHSLLQEMDLAGNVIWQMTAADLNKALATATCSGCNITVVGTHHDFVMLPNGHLVVIAAVQQDVSGTTVTGDVLIDLDQNHNPVWLWNEFDHLDINRRPFLYPDWTHTNAILYSADDGNLIVSIRHQNWLVKIDYENGSGSGNILWHLGYQGDFTLVGGTDPTDWFYAQHGPSFTTKNTTGQFGMAIFDNGDDRVFAPGITCGATGAPPCLYSTVPLLQLDETAMTATLVSNQSTPNYSFFGGNAAVLTNGNVEFCEAAGGPMGNAGTIYEFTQGSSPQQVWELQVPGIYLYRGQRMPSFYPGVQW
jgi:arylsulfate sulfotransferase